MCFWQLIHVFLSKTITFQVRTPVFFCSIYRSFSYCITFLCSFECLNKYNCIATECNNNTGRAINNVALLYTIHSILYSMESKLRERMSGSVTYTAQLTAV